MAHQDVDEDDLHGLQHHMDAHGQLMGQVMPRHGQTTYVPGPLMMDYDMGAPNSYGVPHVLPGHPTQMMLMPMNAPTPTMSMSMPQAPPAAERAPSKKRGRSAATQLKEEIHEQMAAPKKRAAPKRKKSAENGRPAASKRAAVAQPVVMHTNDMVPNMVQYMPNLQMVLQGSPSKDLSVVVDQHGQPMSPHPGHSMSHQHTHSHQMSGHGPHGPHGVLQQEDPNSPGMLGSQGVAQSMTRPRTTDDSRAAQQRSANALREYQRRARETPPERQARRAANAARARQRRAEETPEERGRRLHREALRQQRRRDNETERERAARRAANALRQQERRAREAMARQQQAQIRDQMAVQQITMHIANSMEQNDDVHNHEHYLDSVDDDQE